MNLLTKRQKKLVEEYHYLIGGTIKKMNIPEYAKDDYYGFAAEGLCNAAIKYTPAKGAFQSLAITCIVNRINSERRKIFATHKRGFGDAASVSIDDKNSKYILDQKSFERFRDYSQENGFYDFFCCLDDREKIIVKMIEQGYIYDEIAKHLEISVSCVKKIVKKIKRKYSVN